MSSRSRDLITSCLISAGIVGASELHCCALADSASHGYWKDWFDADKWGTSLATVYGLTTSARNEVILLTPDAHQLASGLTWSNNDTHLVGMSPTSPTGHRTQLQMSANFAAMLTVSGAGNRFANFRITHGRGSATNLNALRITGESNSFVNMHILGPNHSTEGGTEGYRLIKLEAPLQYFKNCHIGGGWDMTAAQGALAQTLVFFKKSVFSDAMFEDCRFMLGAGGTGACFLHFEHAPASGTNWFFQNCHFINVGSTTPTYACCSLSSGGLSTLGAHAYFDADCSFAKVTDIIPVASEDAIWCAIANLNVGSTSAGDAVRVQNMIATHPDVS